MRVNQTTIVLVNVICPTREDHRCIKGRGANGRLAIGGKASVIQWHEHTAEQVTLPHGVGNDTDAARPPKAALAVGGGAEAGLLRRFGNIVSSLDSANAGLEGLLSQAESSDDPGLQRRAGLVHRHLDTLRTHGTRLRAELALAGHGAATTAPFDLGTLVTSAVRDVSESSGIRPLACDVESTSLSVQADPAEIRRTVTALLEAALVAAPPESIRVTVSSHPFASQLLEGSLTAEFRLDVRDIALDLGDLCRALAPSAGSSGTGRQPVRWTRVEVTCGEIHLSAHRIEARTSSWGTRVVVRWPLDLG